MEAMNVWWTVIILNEHFGTMTASQRSRRRKKERTNYREENANDARLKSTCSAEVGAATHITMFGCSSKITRNCLICFFLLLLATRLPAWIVYICRSNRSTHPVQAATVTSIPPDCTSLPITPPRCFTCFIKIHYDITIWVLLNKLNCRNISFLILTIFSTLQMRRVIFYSRCTSSEKPFSDQ